MQQKIQLPPVRGDPFKYLLRLTLDHDVERYEDRRLQCLCKRLDVLFRALVQIGHGKFGTERTKCLGAPPSDRLIVGDTYDQAFLAFQSDLGIRKFGNYGTLSCLARVDGAPISNANVCCAIINSSSVGMT